MEKKKRIVIILITSVLLLSCLALLLTGTNHINTNDNYDYQEEKDETEVPKKEEEPKKDEKPKKEEKQDEPKKEDKKEEKPKDVEIDVSSISLSETEITMLVGDTKIIGVSIVPNNATNKSIRWTSSNSDVVSADNGRITAKGFGTSIVTVTSNNGIKSSLSVTVYNKGDYVHFPKFNIGTGDKNYNMDGTIIQSDNHFALIDTFMNSNGQCNTIINYLEKNNIKELDFVVITHFHGDHCTCFTQIKDKVSIKKVYFKMPNPKASGYSADLKRYNTIANTGVTMQEITKNIEFKWYDYIIHIYNGPQRLTSKNNIKNEEDNTLYDSNVESLVVLAKNGKHNTLITGDIEQIKTGGNYYLNIANAVGHVDIYKTSHHGIYSNNPKDVLDVVTPTYAIITNYNKNHKSANLTVNLLKNYTCDSNIIWTIDRDYVFDITNDQIKLNGVVNSCN